MMSLRKIIVIAGLSPADIADIPRTVFLEAPTTQAHFMQALKNMNKTVCSKTLERYQEWEDKYRSKI